MPIESDAPVPPVFSTTEPPEPPSEGRRWGQGDGSPSGVDPSPPETSAVDVRGRALDEAEADLRNALTRMAIEAAIITGKLMPIAPARALELQRHVGEHLHALFLLIAEPMPADAAPSTGMAYIDFMRELMDMIRDMMPKPPEKVPFPVVRSMAEPVTLEPSSLDDPPALDSVTLCWSCDATVPHAYDTAGWRCGKCGDVRRYNLPLPAAVHLERRRIQDERRRIVSVEHTEKEQAP